MGNPKFYVVMASFNSFVTRVCLIAYLTAPSNILAVVGLGNFLAAIIATVINYKEISQ